MKQHLFHIAVLGLLTVSCGKETGCYDPAIKAVDRMCTMDCPGVCGCDGKDYCNDCIAKQNGISSSTPGSCK